MRGTVGSAVRYQLNNWSMMVIALVVGLTPLALGGNRPAIWALSALLLFTWGTFYFARAALANVRLRATVSPILPLAALFWLLAAFMAIQTFPISHLVPSNLLRLPQQTVSSLTISLNPGDTSLALLRWMSYGILFFFTLQICANRSRLQVFLRVLFWIVVAHAMYGLVLFFEFSDTILFVEKWAYRGAATGAFVNRNSYATFLALGAVLGAALIADTLFSSREEANRTPFLHAMGGPNGVILLSTGLLAITATLALTASRMGFLAAICGVATIVLLSVWPRSRGLGRFRVVLPFLALSVLSLALLFLYGVNLVERLSSVEASAQVREDLYRQIVTMILERPVLGFGGDSFEFVYPLYHQAPVNFDLQWDKAHSTYLALIVDYGILFGIVPVLMIGWCAARLASALKRGERNTAAVAASGAIVVAAIHSTVDFSLEIQGVVYLFVAILAAGMAQTSRYYCKDLLESNDPAKATTFNALHAEKPSQRSHSYLTFDAK